ncbi:MAG: glycosyltransferase family 2 protein [Christensenellaceae bacterium]
MKKDISIITPVYNESENVNDLCATLDEYAKDKPYGMELIFVDDGSKDDTFKKIQQYSFQYASAKLISLSKNYGSHAAIRAGLSEATAKYSMLFSGDLQEPVELIDRLYHKIQEGYDTVYVQKKETQVSKKENFFSKMFAKLVRKYAVKDFPMGGVNNFMISEKVRKIINENVEANSSIFLQVMDLGFKNATVDCDYIERKQGKSKWTLSKKIKLFVDSFVSFSFAPIRAVTMIGCVLSFAGIIYAIYILIMKIFNFYTFAAGWPTLIAVILVGFGLTNISLGIVAEYLWRTLDAARKRPVFIIDEVIEKTQDEQ